VYLPPTSDEIEVSVWGPGYGESVLIHALNNEWIIIDSCVDPITKRQPILDYLEKIDVNPADAIKLVAATHWHDDHIRGLSDLFDKCESADFLMSDALTTKEFLILAESIGKNSKIEGKSGLEEMHKIFQILQKPRCTPSKRNTKVPIRASANKCVWVSPIDPAIRLTSLSPSDYSIFQSQREIASLIPEVSKPKRWLVPKIPNENHVAVVLCLEFANMSLLLGSDLEDDGNPQSGWTAIVNSICKPSGKSTVYKISHHGSKSGDLSRIWEEMLVKNPYAICSPFNHGKTLPSPDDVRRICGYTPNGYITATNRISKSYVHKDSTVKKTIAESGIKFHERVYLPGMVRFRKKTAVANSECSLEYFQGAEHLSNFLQHTMR
jgi:beta-lactamase superfamily II metal-dependent hydrolase